MLTGGEGSDRFVFNSALDAAAGLDQITDFARGADKILLEDAVFNALAAGPLAAQAMFVVPIEQGFGWTPQPTAATRIIYDRASGTLQYDADGNGAMAAVAFAKVAPGTMLTATDFAII